MDRRYDPHAIEEKWQRIWKERDAYRTPDTSDKPKFYCLDFFPYPSGDGLSVGHCRNYVPTDAVARFKRMQGFNVLHPMGWDAFGLPAENYAIKMGVKPRVTTERNIANYHRQMDMIGLSFDWSREITSCDPDYYRWTQWFFLLMYERGLAYRATGQQWWCPRRQDDPRQRAGRARHAAGAAAARSPRRTWSSGTCASPTTRSACWTTSAPSTGPSRSSSCRPTGSAAARAPRSTSGCRVVTSP